MNSILMSLLLFITVAFADNVYDGRSLNRRNTFLITMSNADVVEVLNCVSDSRDPRVCEELVDCLNVFPPRLVMLYRRCRQALVGNSWPQCSGPWTGMSPPGARAKILDCITARAGKETTEEEMGVVRGERCFRDLYANRCISHRRYYGE